MFSKIRRFVPSVLFFFIVNVPFGLSGQINWTVKELVPGGRIDAVTNLGSGVVIAGSRWPNPGMIFRSTDYGISWEKVKTLDKPDGTYRNNEILGLMGGTDGLAYLITSNAQFWRSEDKGMTWKWVAQLGGVTGKPSFSYSICVTAKGTVLVTSGFSIYRSADHGLHFEEIGPITSHYLYRLQKAGNDVFANGWGGELYKSSDDGKSWKVFAQLGAATDPFDPEGGIMKTQPFLTGIEYLGKGRFMQGTMSGRNYVLRRNDSQRSDRPFSTVKGAIDDYAYLGAGKIIAGTFTEGNHIYLSYDGGKNWRDMGRLPTGSKGDWLDHEIGIMKGDSLIMVGGTNRGFMVRAAFHRGKARH